MPSGENLLRIGGEHQDPTDGAGAESLARWSVAHCVLSEIRHGCRGVYVGRSRLQLSRDDRAGEFRRACDRETATGEPRPQRS